MTHDHDQLKCNGRVLVALCAAAVVLLLNQFGDWRVDL